MIGNLLEHHSPVRIWNRTIEKAKAFEEKGATVARTPREAATDADIVCVCVSDTPDVEEVVFGEHGALAGMKEGSLLIDFSTISPDKTKELAARAAEKSVAWIDAPVSGGDVGARNGTLTIMAVGSESDFERAKPVFAIVGKNIALMGPVGSGQQTKMVNQIAVIGTLISMSEALNYAREKEMDLEKVLSVIGSGAAGSWSLQNYGPRVLEGDFSPGFSARLMAKDLRLVLETLEGLEADYEATRKIARLFEKMVENGDGGLGNHGIIEYLGWPGEEE